MASRAYTILDLGTLPGGSVSVARAINNAGAIVGEADVDGAFHAFVCYANRSRFGTVQLSMQDLGSLGGTVTFARSIDQAGHIVGYGETASGAMHPFYHPGFGPIQDLAPYVGPSAFATGVGGQDVIVGAVEVATNAYRAFVRFDGQTRQLGTFGGANSAAAAVEGRVTGIVVGDAETDRGYTRGFLFLLVTGDMIELGTFGGQNSSATAVNADSQVAGVAETAGGARHAFLLSGAQMRDLGTLGGVHSSAKAINAAGHVVGASETAGGRVHAFLYDGAMTDLNSLLPPNSGWELAGATGINDVGQIVGFGVHDGQTRGFLTMPG